MKMPWLAVLLSIFANTTVFAAAKCPTIETSMVNKGFSESAPWRVMSGSTAECSFATPRSSVNFGYNHIASASVEDATAAAVEMRGAVADKSVIEPMLALGDEGFTYQPKKDDGKVDSTSMFFYGHRGSLNVSGYLNLKDAITPAQRDFAAHLISATLGVATHPKALASETTCHWLDPALVPRLLPGSVASIVTDANNCVASADGKVITVTVTPDARSRATASVQLKSGGCTIDPLPKLGTPAGLLHHCSEGNARAEVLFVTAGRLVKLLYVPAAEPTAEERATLVAMAEFAARQ